MKKINYFLFPIVPVLIGYFYNFVPFVIAIPALGSLIYYIFPIIMLLIWFLIGRKYAQTQMRAFTAILVANSLGIISLLLYVWQFIFLTENQRNLFLAGFSQYFSLSITFITAKIAILFEPVKNEFGFVTMFGIQIIGLCLMLLIFTAGFCYEKRK